MKTKSSFLSNFYFVLTGLRPVSTRFLLILALSSALLALCPSPCALSQIPQGFNYQAVARNTTGNAIANATLQVKIGILSDTLTSVIVWEELHPAVKTNSSGVFGLVVGTGTREAGTASLFSDIDWTKTPLYLKVQINYQESWKVMGHAQLWSVPYAMVAEKVDGPFSKLEVTGETAKMDEALFEVKNKDGQIIFAVYNEGVRIYVDDGSKGVKGGFAIGGFGTGKETSQPYFIVKPDTVRIFIDSPDKAKKGGFAIGGYGSDKQGTHQYLFVSGDSIRAYIDTTTTKGVKGGFAIGGFGTTKGNSLDFFNINPENEEIINPSENRILYYPISNSFLVGRVLIEHPDSIGTNSIVTGFESKAIGDWSQAMGYKSIARGDYSTAIGKNALAAYNNSFAFGDSARALSEGAYAFGYKSEASGLASLAFGYAYDTMGIELITEATGASAIAMGIGAGAFATGAVAVGAANEASGDFSLSLGFSSVAANQYAAAIGYGDTARGYSSYAAGMGNRALGDYSFATGYNNIVSGIGAAAFAGNSFALGDRSIVLGYESAATNDGSIAMGIQSYSCGKSSFTGGYQVAADAIANYSFTYGTQAFSKNECTAVFGNGTIASGYAAVAMGLNSTAAGDYSLAIGNNLLAVSSNSAVIGTFNKGLSDSFFEIGNGTDDLNRSNAFTILKNGCVGLGSDNPIYRLQLPNVDDNLGRAIAYEWITYSDSRVKSDIQNLPYGINIIKELQPKMYSHHSSEFSNGELILGDTVQSIGILAQDLYSLIPEAVIKPDDESVSLWGVSYNKLVPVLIKGMQEQQGQIESQQAQIYELKKMVEELMLK